MTRRPLAVLACAVLLAGCSSTPPATASSPPSASTAPVAAPSPTAAPCDVHTILTALQAASLGVSNVAVQDENSDPNNLLGRAHQYTGRASFDLPGGDTSADKYDTARGGVVECFANPADAQARFKYLDGLSQTIAMAAESHYLHGLVIVRVGRSVKPSLAAKVQAVVEKLP